MKQETRVPAPTSQVFFVHPANARFVEGATTHIRTRQRIDLFGHGIVLALLLGCGVLFAVYTVIYLRDEIAAPPSSEQITTLGFAALFALIPLILVALGIPNYRRRIGESRERQRQLEEKGQIITGAVMEYDVHWKQAFRPRQGETRAVLRYRFHAPGQSEIIGTYHWAQIPVRRKPEPGTPLAVLYVDETLHEVL